MENLDIDFAHFQNREPISDVIRRLRNFAYGEQDTTWLLNKGRRETDKCLPLFLREQAA